MSNSILEENQILDDNEKIYSFNKNNDNNFLYKKNNFSSIQEFIKITTEDSLKEKSFIYSFDFIKESKIDEEINSLCLNLTKKKTVIIKNGENLDNLNKNSLSINKNKIANNYINFQAINERKNKSNYIVDFKKNLPILCSNLKSIINKNSFDEDIVEKNSNEIKKINAETFINIDISVNIKENIVSDDCNSFKSLKKRIKCLFERNKVSK